MRLVLKVAPVTCPQMACCPEQVSVLDAGCGEGHVPGTHVRDTPCRRLAKNCEAFGVDVSKTAIRMAAKRHREASFAVASSYVLPFDAQASHTSCCKLQQCHNTNRRPTL